MTAMTVSSVPGNMGRKLRPKVKPAARRTPAANPSPGAGPDPSPEQTWNPPLQINIRRCGVTQQSYPHEAAAPSRQSPDNRAGIAAPAFRR